MQLPEPHSTAVGASPPASGWRWLHLAENLALALSLAGVAAIPLIEAFSRKALGTGLPGANAITQHFTLLVSVFGAAIAAREGRLLTITRGFAHVRAPWGLGFEIARAGFAAGVTLLLAWAGIGYLLSEVSDVDPFAGFGEKLAALGRFFRGDALANPIIAFGVPLWLPLLAMALSFVAIAVRLLRGTALAWPPRFAAALVALALVAVVLTVFPETPASAWWLVAALIASVVLGAPIFTLLGGAAIFLLWGMGDTISPVASAHYRLTTNATIPALPLFTLAGYFLAEGDTSKRMVRLLRAIVGDLHAGPAVVAVVACAFFSSLTGASGVTILALGGLLLPFLTSARYSEKQAIGLLTGADTIGLLIAPCLPLIIYAIVANIDIKAIFLAGVLPSVLIIGATAAWATHIRPRAATAWKFDAREVGRATVAALPELLIPVVSLGSIFMGWATAVESAALTALYTLLIKMCFYRDLKPGALLRVVSECGLLIGGVLLILGVAQGLTNYLIVAQVPELLVTFVTTHITSKLVFIALLTVVLLIVGCLMDVFSAIMVVAPLVIPLGREYGVDPVHLGILFLANLLLGFLTPPVGMNLFLSSYRFNKPMSEVLRAALPYFWVQFGAVILISYWPALSLFLPRLFGYDAPPPPP